MRSILRLLFVLGLGALSVACAPRAVTPPPIQIQPPLATVAQSCYDALTQLGAKFEARQNMPRNAQGCFIDEPVMLEQATIPLNRPALMTCPLAQSLAEFERDVVQPAAQRHFNRPVAQIIHYGAYVCRAQTGRASRLSEHGMGRAFDIGGFELAGNIRISVKDHWRERGPRGAFLREVAQGACRHFNLVLTPKSDAAHQDHFHFDIGRWARCDA